MHIHEATKKALESQSALKRAEWEEKGLNVIVIPTNINMPLDGVILGNPQRRAHNWNPTPDDLMANDWEVTKV